MGARGRVQLPQERDPLTWSPRFVRESGGLLEGVELPGELVTELWRKCGGVQVRFRLGSGCAVRRAGHQQIHGESGGCTWIILNLFLKEQ